MNEGNRIKVLFCITKSNWGGAQKYVYDLATSLPTDRFEVAVAAGGSGLLLARLAEVGIRTISLPGVERDIRLWQEIPTGIALIKLFFRERPDIVHLNSAKIGGSGALAARLAGVRKIVFTAHGWTFEETRPKWQRWLIYFFSWLTVLFCTDLITISRANYQTALHFPFAKQKTTLVYNGLDLGGIRGSTLGPQKGRTSFFRKEGLLFGTIAELHRNKGLDVLIEALATVAGAWSMVVIGEGEERRELEYLIRRRGLEDRVDLIGFRADAANYLKAFDLFILPSRKEGFPYVLLEAGGAELPVVVTRVGGVGEIIEDGVSGLLVPPNDEKALAAAIQELAEDPTLRARLGKNLRKKIESHFTLAQMIPQTIEVYTK